MFKEYTAPLEAASPAYLRGIETGTKRVRRRFQPPSPAYLRGIETHLDA